MGFRRRTRRRAIIAGAAIAHHEDKKYAEAQAASAQEPAYAPPEPDPSQYAPPPPDPAEQIDHFAQLHASGAITDEEFAAAKAKVLGT